MSTHSKRARHYSTTFISGGMEIDIAANTQEWVRWAIKILDAQIQRERAAIHNKIESEKQS